MTRPLRLILFDVDGTLVDSQASIVAAMTAAFSQAGLTVPDRKAVLSIVGLSLDHAMVRLAPDAPDHDGLVQAYKDAYFLQRQQGTGATAGTLYPGALETLHQLAAVPENILGVATGKSRRGLDALLAEHELGPLFVTCQVSDQHPSKPHPSMIETAMAETGVDRASTVMIGDTSFDMDMAVAAAVRGVGVSWGYHEAAALHRATAMIDHFADLPPVLDRIWTAQE